MSLRGYQKKTKPAPWRVAFPEQADPSYLPSHVAALHAKVNGFPQNNYKLRESPQRRMERRIYSREAKAFVVAAVARGETCPIVAAVPELRDGMRYGHRISARLNEVHHIRGRSGKLLLDKRFWLAVSKAGHRWVHEHPKEAQALGWLAQPGEWGRRES